MAVLPTYVANNSYTIKYTAGEDVAYRTARKKVDKKMYGKEYITVFTKLTVAEYTAIIASDWS